jgi:hypothetical protein
LTFAMAAHESAFVNHKKKSGKLRFAGFENGT